MTKCYVCIQTPFGNLLEMGDTVFMNEDDAEKFCDLKNKNESLASRQWYYEEYMLK